MATRVRVAVNGYGVIGKRVADAVALQEDMELAGIVDIVADHRIRVAASRGYPVYAAGRGQVEAMRAAGIPAAGRLETCCRPSTSLRTALPSVSRLRTRPSTRPSVCVRCFRVRRSTS